MPLPEQGGTQKVEKKKQQESSLFSPELPSILNFAKKIANSSYSKDELEQMAREAESTIDSMWREQSSYTADLATIDVLNHAETLDDIVLNHESILRICLLATPEEIGKMKELLEVRDVLAESDNLKAREYYDQIVREIDRCFHNLVQRIQEKQHVLFDIHTESSQEQGDRLNEILGIPGVKSLLDEWQKEGVDLALQKTHERAEDERRGEEEAKMLEQDARVRATSYVRILAEQHDAAWKRVGSLVPKKIADQIDVLRSGALPPSKEKSLLDSILDCLLRAIHIDDGENRIATPGAVVPWRMQEKATTRGGKRVGYFKAFDGTVRNRTLVSSLRDASKNGDGESTKFLTALKAVDRDFVLLNRLFGREKEKTEKGEAKELSAFWRAFDERKRWDKQGKTESERKEAVKTVHEETRRRKQEKALQNEIKKVADKPLGLAVVVSGKPCAVLLEKIVGDTKWGWKISECLAIPNELVRPGARYFPDLSNAPTWLRAAAREKKLV